MRFFLAGVGMATALVLAGCAGTSLAPRWQHASNRHHHHHAVHSVWRTATTGRSSTDTGGSTGLASFYRVSRTASGERPTGGELTAAHRSLPFGTRVRVTNLNNHRSVTVRINDRGPFVTNRSIDLSYGAASAIGMTGAGVSRVHMEVLQ
jgi:rare lipoprotein A